MFSLAARLSCVMSDRQMFSLAARLSCVMSDRQIRAHFKYFQIKTHGQTALESRDLNTDFSSFDNEFNARMANYLCINYLCLIEWPIYCMKCQIYALYQIIHMKYN